MADCEQPLRDRIPAARMTPLAAGFADFLRQPTQETQHAPGNHRGDNGAAKPNREFQQREMRSSTIPWERDIARLIGKPSGASGRERDQQQEEDDPVHRRLWRGLGERRHRFGREPMCCRKCRIALGGLVEPSLRRRTIGGSERIQFAPRLGHVVA
jgi:hypothetical protein